MGTERQRELRRRRSRSKKVAGLAAKAKKANKSEKAVIAQKLRQLTPGAEQIISAWKLHA
jgi:ribosomal protein L15E